MNTKAQMWGNSIAVRIPKAMADKHGIKPGTEISFTDNHENLVLKAETEEIKYREHPKFKEFMAQVTPENIHPEVDWGPPVGNEIW